MIRKRETTDVELICIIVNAGFGSKIMRFSKKYGVSGGTVLIGKGTIHHTILEKLALNNIKKEIILMITTHDTANYALQNLNNIFKFSKPNHGIAFTVSINQIFGTSNFNHPFLKENREEHDPMYHVITVIVKKGRAEDVMDAATNAGAKGGTVINGRGSGIHETSKVFSMEIEPGKEIILILSESNRTNAIVTSIRKEMNIDEPGNGLIFVQDTNKTYGLYQ